MNADGEGLHSQPVYRARPGFTTQTGLVIATGIIKKNTILEKKRRLIAREMQDDLGKYKWFHVTQASLISYR